jgi:hypothetical protein
MVVGYSAAVLMAGLFAVVAGERPKWALRLLMRWVQRGVDKEEKLMIAAHEQGRVRRGL